MSDETVLSTEGEEREPGSTRAEARDLGDVTQVIGTPGVVWLEGTVGGDGVDYYRFTLSESRGFFVALALGEGESVVSLEDASGAVLSRSMSFQGYEAVIRGLEAGTYYLRVESVGGTPSAYELGYYGVPARHASLAIRLRQMGAPEFGQESYGFELAEERNGGGGERVLLGTVGARDPGGESLRYAIVGGNESGRFAIDGQTGSLYYVGPGEDYEGGDGPYELTVRVGDGTHTVDTAVTVTVSDESEAPSFGEASYAFDLPENTDGSNDRVSLGTVRATDPDGAAVRYELVRGNESERFDLDEQTGELSYVGPGENYEGGDGPYELTVRADDGTHTVDTAVTVTVSDESEAPSFGEASYAFALPENTDGRIDRVSLGEVRATDPDGESVRYAIVAGDESGRFAIDAASGELFYVGPGEDYEGGDGPYTLTVRVGDGTHTVDATVTVMVSDAVEAPAFGESYAFALLENTDGSTDRVSLGEVTATDPDGDEVRYELVGGNERGLFHLDPVSGELFYVGPGEDYEGGDGPYDLTVRASDRTHAEDATVTVTVTDAAEAPSFGSSSYAFALPEHVDGSTDRVLLGTVSATDPDRDTLRYELVGGNERGLFRLDPSSGELSYVGPGEDYEGGDGPYELTVRASDGTHTVDTSVTVTVSDAAEAPSFVETSYAFALPENVDGRADRVLLGMVSATDPDGDTVRYELVGGNESERFDLDEQTGALYYVGSGEDYEGGDGPYELTVRASDGTHTVDTTVMVTVSDEAEGPTFVETSYAFALLENTDGSADRVSLGEVRATDPDGDTMRYAIVGGNESDRFAIGEHTGALYYIGPGEDYESGDGPYTLTVRAGDGTHTVDTTVTVTVSDAAEAPAFGETSYAFPLPEHVDGRAERVSLGIVSATDPDRDTLRYELVGGNERGLFRLDPSSGELSYVGPGEDYEGGDGPYHLTVRARDGTHTVDTTVTVTVSDEAEAPSFVETSYAFALPENVDGRADRVSLGEVTATDPDGDEVRYELVGVEERGLFHLDPVSGELFYVGPGEDYERVSGPYELVVHASDGTHAADATVTVTVIDAAEAPSFVETSYAFVLPENTDGRTDRVLLGTVPATDPDGEAVRYELVGGNESGRFVIDEHTGALYYIGPGEDYEGGDRPYTLTVRAGDGTHTVDTTVTVTVSDVPGESEPVGGDLPAGRETGGVVGVDAGPVTGDIESVSDQDWFAVELVGGRTYVIEQRGSETGDGTLLDPYFFGVYDSEGRRFPGTTAADGGLSYNSRLVFTAPADGRYYVSAAGGGGEPWGLGTYELEVRDVRAPEFASRRYAYALSENADGRTDRVSLGVVLAVDPDGAAVRYGLVEGNESGRFAIDAQTGELSYVGPGEDYEGGVRRYELTVRADDGAYGSEAPVLVMVTDEAEAPSFGETSYAFVLPENADGSVTRVSLGSVLAVDPDGDTLRYALVAGNESSRFAIDEQTGELSYVGPGEDYEGGDGPYELTVRAGDGAHSVDTTVTVTVGDEPEPPAFGETSYAFALLENTDGSTDRVLLGTVRATDSDGDALRYAILEGNESGRFAVDESSGEFHYIGPGEDYEGGTRRYELTVSAHDGAYASEATVVVSVTDEPEAPSFGEASYAFALPENTDGSTDRTLLGTVTATDPDGDAVRYAILRGNESGRFAVDESSGEIYYIGPGEDYEGGTRRYELTVSAYDGAYASEATVVVSVTDEPEAPSFGEASYAFVLPENTDGSTDRALLGTVTATDPDGDAVRYELVGGNGSGRFHIDEQTGALYYTGSGEDYEGGDGPYALNVRASGGTHTVDTSVTVTVTDVQGESEPTGEDLPAGRETSGVAEVGEGSVSGTLASQADRDWFAVTLEPGRTYGFAVARSTPGGGPAPVIHALRDANGDLVPGIVIGVEVQYTTPAAADQAVYYVEIGSQDDSVLGTSAVRGLGRQSAGSARLAARSVEPRNDPIDFSIDYHLTVWALSDDYSADTTTEGTVAMNGSARGDIQYAGDLDWFAVEFVAGQVYRIWLQGSPRIGTQPDPYLHGIYDSESNLIPGTSDDNGGIGRNSRVTYVATRSGKHFIAAGGHDLGTYRLSVDHVPDDHPADMTTTGMVAVGGSAGGWYQFDGDRDWFAVELVAGTTYRFDLTNVWVNSVLHGIHDSAGVLIDDTSDYDGWNSRVTYTATQDGKHFISVGAQGGFLLLAQVRSPYQLSVSEVQDDHRADITTTTTILVGGSIYADIELVGDSDWFRVELEAGKSYRIEIGLYRWGGSSNGLSTPGLDGMRDSDGNRIGGPLYDVSGLPFRTTVHFTPSEGGTYFIPVTGNGSTGTYRVTVTAPADDHLASRDTTGRVPVGGPPAEGEFEFAFDQDWVAVELVAGTTYRFDLEVTPTPDRPWYHVRFLRGIYDQGGKSVGDLFDWGSGANSTVFHTAAADGTYYVDVGAQRQGAPFSYSIYQNYHDTYRLRVTTVEDDYSADTETEATVAVGGSAPGNIQYAGDRDWFEVEFVAETTYRIDLEGSGRSSGTLARPYLRGVYDSEGNPVGDTFDTDRGVNGREFYTAAASGVYYIAAGAEGSDTGTYRLRVWAIADDYTADTGTDGTVAVGSSKEGVIETPGDRDWFEVELEKDRSYRIDLAGTATKAGTQPDPYLHGIYDSESALIDGTSDDDGGWDTNSRVYYAPTEDGTYYIAAAGHDIGSYRLSVEVAPDSI